MLKEEAHRRHKTTGPYIFRKKDTHGVNLFFHNKVNCTTLLLEFRMYLVTYCNCCSDMNSKMFRYEKNSDFRDYGFRFIL